jgi:hypothetical protein
MRIFFTSDRPPNTAANSLPNRVWRGKLPCRQARQYNVKILISFLIPSFTGAFWTLKQIFSLSSGSSRRLIGVRTRNAGARRARHAVAERVVIAADPSRIAELFDPPAARSILGMQRRRATRTPPAVGCRLPARSKPSPVWMSATSPRGSSTWPRSPSKRMCSS